MRIITAIAAILVLAACAPEPTTPSSESLAGTWTSGAHLFALSSLRMQLVQEPQGVVSGSWSAKRDAGSPGCPEATPCANSGSVIGLNTVAQVEIDLTGAGRFEGALLERNRLRGIFALGEAFDTITFVRNGQ